MFGCAVSPGAMSKVGTRLWFCGPAAGDSVNTAQTPAELLVKMEALIRPCFSGVTETPIRVQVDANFIDFTALTLEYKKSHSHNYLLKTWKIFTFNP